VVVRVAVSRGSWSTGFCVLVACLCSCALEERKPAVDLTVAAMGDPETDRDEAAVELLRLGLTMEAYRAEGLDGAESTQDEFAYMRRVAAELEELVSAEPGTSPDAVRGSLERNAAFDAQGRFDGDRAGFRRTVDKARNACSNAWTAYASANPFVIFVE
jgi:hypothetical protein